MQASAYNGVFGALTQQRRLDLISNNLANVNTTGFKREHASFRDVFARYAHDYINPNTAVEDAVPWFKQYLIAKPRVNGNHIVYEQGGMKQTGNPLDLALEGEGFFKVRGPKGDFFTRSGMFRRSDEGNIVDQSGNKLLVGGSPVKLPPQGRVQVGENGLLLVNEEPVGTIDIASIKDLGALQKIGKNLYRINERWKNQEGLEEFRPEGTQISQGFLETSNVEVVQEMVNMIDTLRIFEACQKVVSSTQETDQRLMNKVGNGN